MERIQRKLDEAILQQQKDKKTNEETLDAFQADIDALEKEKQDLKVDPASSSLLSTLLLSTLLSLLLSTFLLLLLSSLLLSS